MNIKLVALDLDGTALRSDGTLSNRNRTAIQAAARCGSMIVPVTGRVLSELPNCIRQLSEIRYIITSNGASVLDMAQNRQIYANFIPSETAQRVWDQLARYDVFIECYFDGNSVVSQDAIEHICNYKIKPESVHFIKNHSIVVDDLIHYLFSFQQPKLEKLNIRTADLSDFEKIWKSLDAIPEVVVTSAGWGCIEVNHFGINKATGLSQLCKSVSISRREVLAMGDGLNDKEMLEFCGLSVAMKNAVDEIVKIAKYTTDTNDRDGVGLAIEKFVLQKFC